MSKRYTHIARALHESPWAILPAKLDEILAFVNLRFAGEEIPAEQVEAIQAATRRPQYAIQNSTAVLPIYGTIVPRSGTLADMSGATSVQRFRRDFQEALNDPEVGSILLDIDSPGGSVDGIPELAADIRAARGTKPIVAIANTFAASGAYWLAAQADELVVSPSGMVGSIGVVMTHVDRRREAEMEGLEISYVHAGQYKVEGNPYEELSDDTRDYYQGIVDEIHGDFVQAIAKGRGITAAAVRRDFGEGRMVMPREALRLGMVDRIESIQQTLTRMSRGRIRSRTQRRAENERSPATTTNVDRRRREQRIRSAKRRLSDEALADTL